MRYFERENRVQTLNFLLNLWVDSRSTKSFTGWNVSNMVNIYNL